MTFFQRLEVRLRAEPRVAPASLLLLSRIDVSSASSERHVVTDGDGGRRLLGLLRSIDLSTIALHAVLDAPTRALPDGREWCDVCALRATSVSLAVWAGAGPVILATLDLTVPAVLEVLGEILRLRTTIVVHDLKPLLMALWNTGLDPDLHALHDTHIAAAALCLGRFHKRSVTDPGQTEVDRIAAEHDIERQRTAYLAIEGQRTKYGVECDDPAEAVLRVYVAQNEKIARRGLGTHLQAIEFPFVVANARIEWRGVHVDPAMREKVREAAERAAQHCGAQLVDGGVIPPGSRDAFLRVMAQARLADLFRAGVEDSELEGVEGRHPLIRAFRFHRRYSRLSREEWLRGTLIGSDGRVHPQHHQLGAATGRNTCTLPNLPGIGRVLRPVVTAQAGRAIVEFDYAQVEVGVAAAEHGDRDLIDAYNSGDVYAAMAQRFYAAELSPDEAGMSPAQFKLARPALRDRMKTFVLAVLYNLQAQGIADRFGIPLDRAERERTRFLDTFPVLKRRLEESAEYGAVRGYAATVTGLRRVVESGQELDTWTKNYLRNTPIQGSAASVFKRAVIDFDRSCRGTNTWIILPVHDALVVECDQQDLHEVCERGRRILEDALRGIYPALKPKVDVNRKMPWCWNKDGCWDSVDRFLEDPEYTIGAPRKDANSAREIDPLDCMSSDAECGPRAEEHIVQPCLPAGDMRAWRDPEPEPGSHAVSDPMFDYDDPINRRTHYA